MTTLSFGRSILFVKGMDIMFAFYTGVLATSGADHPYWHILSSSGSELALHRMPEHWRVQVHIATPPEPRESAVTKMVFWVDDLETVCANLKTNGVTFINNPYLNPPREFIRTDFTDPEENVVQLSLRDAG